MKRLARAGAISIAALVPLAGCGGDGNNPAGAAGESDFGCVDGRSPLYEDRILLWGDLHGHTVYSDDAAAQNPPPGPPEEAYAYAADPAGGNLDFAALTDHAETMDSAEWAGSISACKEAEGGDFVPFLGFEYTNCSREAGHGHKCVLFRDPAAVTDSPIGADRCADPAALWTLLGAALPAGEYMTIPHHPAKGIQYTANMSTDWDDPWVDEERQPLVEVYSVHGNSESAGCEEPVMHFREDRTVEAALGRWLDSGDPGYKLGIVGSTDNHRAAPGSVQEREENLAEMEGPYTGGLVAVWAAAPDRDGIWNALWAKSAYGTSGGRIEAEFTAKGGGMVVPMGETLLLEGGEDVLLHVRATGEGGAGIARIEIFKNGVLLAADSTDHLDFRDAAVSSRTYYRAKIRQAPTPMVHDDHCPNERAWTSPIWVEPAAE